ncbi:TetR/AcrR family transcriptional regulator [Aquihabitans daechungensis]|uniref:TetR/AcrR family transcriptional regulator n=1 Tax=Aquihabitans daechungensis TaxID=1052257 RepID=UPI003B9F1B3A
MNATAPTADLEGRLRALPAPRPMLSRDDLHRLTDRQRELLAQLGSLFRDGFADLTMSEIAARLNCSLRTLYGLAPSRDELVLTVVDTHLWRVGREAMATINPEMAPLDALRTYLSAATVAVSGTTEAYSRDLAAMPAARRRNGDHADYVVAVTRTLLDIAVERGDIADVDTAAVARTLANLGQDFIAPEVMATLRTSPKVAADGVVDIILRGLAATEPDPES